MELVYLWVEDYKNIKKQGFNFSPNFECEFFPVYEDGKLSEKSELKITPKENRLKDFFGKNINITAIVGENGSGKSGILDLLFLTYTQYTQSKYKYIIFYRTESTVYCHASFDDSYLIQCSTYDIKPLSCFDNNKLNIKYLSILEKNFIPPILKNKIKEIYKTNISYEQNILINSLKLFANQNEIILKDKNIHFDDLSLKINKIPLSDSIDKENKSKYLNFVNVNFSFKDTPENKYHDLNNFVIINILTALVNYFNETDDFDKFTEIFDTTNQEITMDKILLFIIPEKHTDICSLLDDTKKVLEQLKQFDFNCSNLGTSKLYYESIMNINEKKDVLIEFIKKFNYFINFYDDTGYLEFKMFDIDLYSNNINFKGLSDGEKSIYSKIVEVKYELMSNEIMNIFLLDEPDNFLHPNWSREFIKILLDNINDEKVQFILTSHSPFILSDLPKENVIFLEKDKETGNCINATNKVNINPFGANIHTLLSHGFFMKDGLMGEFAKSKIDKSIKYLNQKAISKEELDYCENIISIIGEPIIKRELQRMLKNKMELSNKTEIDKIREKVDTLTKELEESYKRLEELEKKDKK